MLHLLMATMACKAAVKAGDKLSPEEITYLLHLREHGRRQPPLPARSAHLAPVQPRPNSISNSAGPEYFAARRGRQRKVSWNPRCPLKDMKGSSRHDALRTLHPPCGGSLCLRSRSPRPPRKPLSPSSHRSGKCWKATSTSSSRRWKNSTPRTRSGPPPIFKLDKKLKGETPFDRIPMNMTGDDEAKKEGDTKKVFDRLDSKRELVFFVRSGEALQREDFRRRFVVLRLRPTRCRRQNAVRLQAFLHGEPFLRRTFKGTSAEMVKTVENALAKKAKPPEPDEGEATATGGRREAEGRTGASGQWGDGSGQ